MKLLAALLLALPTAGWSDVLRIGTNSDYPAFMFRNDAGERIGHDKDLADLLCARIGQECVWVELPVNDLIDNLVSGNVDMVIGGIGFTAERDLIVDFSCVYYDTSGNVGVYYAVREGIDLDDAQISVVRGTVHEQALLDAGQATVGFVDGTSAIAAMIDGKVDAYFGAPNYVYAYTQSSGRTLLAIDEREVPTTGPAIAVADGNDSLRQDLNAALGAFALDGTLSRLAEQWFGESNRQAPPDCDQSSLQSKRE